MAKVITIQVLCDEYETKEKEILSAIKNHGGVMDITVESIGITNDALDDSIANDTYEEGDAFRKWVIHHCSTNLFWSDEVGNWVALEFATRYDSTDRPDSDEPFGAPGYGCYFIDQTTAIGTESKEL